MTTQSQQQSGLEQLRRNGMMQHLIESMENGLDIGHYGRLVFAMIAHHFISDDEIARLICNDPNISEEEARALCKQVRARDYNPPRREKIAEWQRQQDFPICPTTDPDACNVYRDLKFPDNVYEHIEEYYEQKP